MSKNTIYIEPEDDITDVINKIENASEKVVALVPPKKAGIFRSIVNIKLISKASKTSSKNVVLITTDPSITKLAAATNLPVAKNLQSTPSVPVLNADVSDKQKEETIKDEDASSETNSRIEESEKKDTQEQDKKSMHNVDKDDDEDENEDRDEYDDDEDSDEDDKNNKKKKKKHGKGGGIIGWIKNHKVLSIIIGIGILALIIFLIWAIFIAPSVDIAISIKTESNNFSESISFVKDQSQENIAEGMVFLEERKLENVNKVNFEATGQKNRGERATGSVVAYAYFNAKGTFAINAGTIFTINNLSYASNSNVSLSWDGNKSTCENKDSEEDPIIEDGVVRCLVSVRVKVTATNAGEKYNIPKSSVGWDTIANLTVYSDEAMTGGTDDVIKVVQQSDVEKVRGELSKANEEENKAKLYASIPKDSIILESTFSQSTSAAKSVPAVDEEVKEGVVPALETTTTTSVFIIDKTKLEELIRSKVQIGENQKIFEIRDVYVDGFRELQSGFTGKLKALYFTGPKITEGEVVEKIKGRGLGDAQREIKDIQGITEVKINTSYPWVMSVPSDTNKIKITFDIKDQDGKKIEENKDSESSDDKNQEDGSNTEEKENQ